jgi:hypothetical protein
MGERWVSEYELRMRSSSMTKSSSAATAVPGRGAEFVELLVDADATGGSSSRNAQSSSIPP